MQNVFVLPSNNDEQTLKSRLELLNLHVRHAKHLVLSFRGHLILGSFSEYAPDGVLF